MCPARFHKLAGLFFFLLSLAQFAFARQDHRLQVLFQRDLVFLGMKAFGLDRPILNSHFSAIGDKALQFVCKGEI